VAVAVLAGCASDTDKIGERLARQQLSSQYLVASLSAETCATARQLAARDPTSEGEAAKRCRVAGEARAELARLERAYAKACRACAPLKRCETALERLREREGRQSEEGACP